MIERLDRPYARPFARPRVKGSSASSLTLQIVMACALIAAVCSAEEPVKPKPAEIPIPKKSGGVDLLSLSLEELMKIKVTSVSKTPEKANEAAAAVFVITNDDIRRSGVTSIPEALRMAPGMQVAKLDSNRWAISCRDYNDEFNAKLLVLMDGRSVYTPLFSGVFWDVQDTMLDDIDRIEVVRGPAGTLWGANAVNGVINIITKSAKDTQGILANVGAGTEETGFGNVRYGGKIGKNAFFRVYGKYFAEDNSATPNGGEANDRRDMLRGGFRVDWDASQHDAVTFQGDAYSGREDERFFDQPTRDAPFITNISDRSNASGANVLGRWSHQFSETSNLKLQSYFDHTSRSLALLREDRNTYDLDLQYQFAVGDRHELICGVGARANQDDTDGTFVLSYNPADRTTTVFSAFVQDKIELIKKRLSLTLGSKFEVNTFTGFEYQPNARLFWKATEKQSLWASVSRAVRTPSRTGNDVRFNAVVDPTVPVFSQLQGSNDVKSEQLLAYELGYRVQPIRQVSLDLALFCNTYDDLVSFETKTPSSPPPPVFVPIKFDNKMTGEIYGGELAAKFQPLKRWRIQASYSFQRIQLHTDSSSTDTFSEKNEGNSPRNQANMRSSVDLPKNVELDVGIRYVDRLESLKVPSYVVGDVRVGWKPTKNLEISVVGQNLFEKQHPEFPSTFVNYQRTEVQHSGYIKMTLKF